MLVRIKWVTKNVHYKFWVFRQYMVKYNKSLKKRIFIKDFDIYHHSIRKNLTVQCCYYTQLLRHSAGSLLQFFNKSIISQTVFMVEKYMFLLYYYATKYHPLSPSTVSIHLTIYWLRHDVWKCKILISRYKKPLAY